MNQNNEVFYSNEDNKNVKTKIIQITERALIQLADILNKERPEGSDGIRLGIVGGGCSGLSYKIEFGGIKERDNVLECNGIKILIDPKSAIYLKDVILDFKDGLDGKGFVFENPNAKNTCGCGESFSV